MMRLLARFAMVCALTTALPACGTLYLAQAARGQWQVMRARQPIERVLSDARTAPQVRSRLSEVREARDFASAELRLPDNASYRSYADIHRPFVVWNVVATPELSMRPKKWCFPIVGCVTYRGYFREGSARAYAANLTRQGYDVTIGGVPAYSTLGRTADPVLSSMLRYGEVELIAMLFHELAHQVVYVAGDAAFNEAFATTVEQAGLERWLKKQGRESQLAGYVSRRADFQQYLDLLMRYREELANLYASKLDTVAMRARKREIFAELAAQMRELEVRQGRPSPYQDWLREGLNNAQLASVATYFNCVPGFEKLLASDQGDLQAFYASVKRLAGEPRAQRHSQLCAGPAS